MLSGFLGKDQVPEGYYNIETMLKALCRHGGIVGVCGSCMDALGIKDVDLDFYFLAIFAIAKKTAIIRRAITPNRA